MFGLLGLFNIIHYPLVSKKARTFMQFRKQRNISVHYYFPREYYRITAFVIFVVFLIFFLWLSPARADNVISGGTTVRINSGTFVTTVQNLLVENGGRLAVEGSLVLKGNLINQNTNDDLGAGTITFSGTTPQSISGRNTFGSLVVDNMTGLDITGNTVLNTGLALQNGTIRLGTNNLTLSSSATVTGTPSATAMVIATGTGEFRKSFSGIGTFTFPVGDNTGTAEYTPVTMTFTNGTFAAGNYAGVKLSNSAYTGLSGNYLNRYWTLTQSGITSAQYNAIFQYVPADVVGIETSLNSVQLEPAPVIAYNPADALLHQLTTNGITTFGIFSGFSKFVQEIILNNGWNIFSSYVTPVNPNLKDVFQLLIDAGKLKKVMDETGKTIENFGAFGGWKNNIGNLNSSKGYKVNVSEAVTLSLEGVPIPLPADISMLAGWNIISYPSSTAQDAMVLIQPLIDSGQLKKVMDETGKTIENFGAFGGWKNNIGNFLPGKGYKVNVTAACTLSVTAPLNKSAILVPEVLASSHFSKVYTGNGTDHFNVHLVDLASSGLQAGDQIGIFDGRYCVGAATIGVDQLINGNISIPASSNDEITGKVNGFTVDHPVTLQLYRENQVYPLAPAKVSGSEAFEKNGSLFLRVTAGDLPAAKIGAGADQVKCYPNPFVDQLTIEIRLTQPKELEVSIYDLNGKLVRSLFKGDAGTSETLFWDGTNGNGAKMGSGTYILKANGMIEKVAVKK
jgi:hypothetical protein